MECPDATALGSEQGMEWVTLWARLAEREEAGAAVSIAKATARDSDLGPATSAVSAKRRRASATRAFSAGSVSDSPTHLVRRPTPVAEESSLPSMTFSDKSIH
jgi:hypothetical protein